MTTRQVSASTVVAASPEEVFALLADPRRHAEFDGSGTVRDAVSGPGRLGPGARFGMRMHLGVPYRVSNTVVEFEEGRRIGWRHVGRHVWRYELAAVPGGTRVTETFDYGSAISPGFLELIKAPARNKHAIRATLVRLTEIFSDATGRPTAARP